MKELKIFFVDNEKENSRLAEKRKSGKKDYTMILLELPWGWEILVSIEVYNNTDFPKNLNSLSEDNRWTLSSLPDYPNFYLIREIDDVTKERISWTYANLGLEFEEKDLQECASPPKPKKPPKKERKKVSPPKEKMVRKNLVDWKKLAAGDYD